MITWFRISGFRLKDLGAQNRKTGLVVLTVLGVLGLAGCIARIESLLSGAESESWLYAQTAKQGTVTAADIDDYYIIEMNDASATTVGFTSRPFQDAVSIPTASFINEWDAYFGNSPPNASLVFDESEEIYVFALSGPVFHPVDHTLWFHAQLIPDSSTPEPPTEFEFISIFIDDAGAANSASSDCLSNSTSLSLAYSSADTVCLSYSALPASKPLTDGSFVALFTGSDANVYEAEPLQRSLITSDSSAGYSTFYDLDLSNTQYTAAYGVGNDRSTICAVVTFGPTGGSESASATAITINSIGSNYIAVSYSTPTGNTPHTNGNWIGVWEEYFDPDVPPHVFENVSSDVNMGSLTLNDIDIEPGVSYIVGYIMGEDASNLAATITFSN